MAVKGHTGKTIVREFVVDDHVAGNQSNSAPVGENANSRTRPRDLKPVMGRLVIANGVANDAQVWSC